MTVASSGARSLQIPATGVVGSIADQQESPWWEGRTWEGEVEVCGSALHDTRWCLDDFVDDHDRVYSCSDETDCFGSFGEGGCV